MQNLVEHVIKDRRFSFNQEWCGYREKRHVARFCGNWIGQDKTLAGAHRLAANYQAARIGFIRG